MKIIHQVHPEDFAKYNTQQIREKFLLENRVYKPAFDLFPIPQTEREKDKALTQNPGY